jgi:hypothetical protein
MTFDVTVTIVAMTMKIVTAMTMKIVTAATMKIVTAATMKIVTVTADSAFNWCRFTRARTWVVEPLYESNHRRLVQGFPTTTLHELCRGRAGVVQPTRAGASTGSPCEPPTHHNALGE